MKIQRLLAPGPTPVPPEVTLAMSGPMIYHRSPAFKEISLSVTDGLKYLFQTTGDVLYLACSGTGGMEGAVVNTLARGDKAIVIRGGKFGERWGKICAAYGVEAVHYDVEWGHAADPARVRELLAQHPDARAVFVQASETSTATAHPIEAIAKIVRERPETLFIVDGITGVGVMDLPVDAWGIDVLVAGSQKALMMPPGLALVSLSAKARKAMERSTLPKFYFNFASELKSQANGETAYTPAVTLAIGLNHALKMIRATSLPKVFAHHARLAKATQVGFQGMGLTLYSKAPSPAVTGVWAPQGMDGQAIVKGLRVDHNMTIAGGQDHLKGKIFRVSHMGYVDRFDILAALAATGDVITRLGGSVDTAAGIKAAEAVFAAEGG